MAWKTTSIPSYIAELHHWVDLLRNCPFLFVSQIVSAITRKIFFLPKPVWICGLLCAAELPIVPPSRWWSSSWRLLAEGPLILAPQQWSYFFFSVSFLLSQCHPMSPGNKNKTEAPYMELFSSILCSGFRKPAGQVERSINPWLSIKLFYLAFKTRTMDINITPITFFMAVKCI